MTDHPEGGTGAPVRVAHVISHPVPYFAPLYRELHARREIALTVYFVTGSTAGAAWDPGFDRSIDWGDPLLAGYRSVVCGAGAPNPWAIPAALVSALWRERYDVVWVHGYARAASWAAAALALATGALCLIREEATLLRSRRRWRVVAKELPLRVLLGRSVGLYIGEENQRYLRRYGIPERRLYPARYCVDTEFLAAQERRLRPGREALRARFGIVGDIPVALFVGKLAPHKRVLDLIRAFALLAQRGAHRLLIVGDGPLRDEAKGLAERLGVDVCFLGFLPPSRLPEAYVAADVFVLPSGGETWGLVINEALAFGLPVVVSDRVGCAADLVQDGQSGYVVPHDDIAALAAALDRLLGDEALRLDFGRRGRALAAPYTVSACADGIVAACLAARLPLHDGAKR